MNENERSWFEYVDPDAFVRAPNDSRGPALLTIVELAPHELVLLLKRSPSPRSYVLRFSLRLPEMLIFQLSVVRLALPLK